MAAQVTEATTPGMCGRRVATLLGQGNYCQAFLVDDTTVEKRAINADDNALRGLRRECEILSKLHHENVVRFVGSQSHSISIEYAGTCLTDMMLAVGPLGDCFLRDAIAVQIIRAVAYVHSQFIWHLDVKLDNMGIGTTGVVKIFDFGLAHDLATEAMGSTKSSCSCPGPRGTLLYAAPEVLSQKPYDGYMSDTWSVGICIFAITYGFFPFQSTRPTDAVFSKVATCKSIPLAILSIYDTRMQNLRVTNCLPWLDGMMSLLDTRRYVGEFIV